MDWWVWGLTSLASYVLIIIYLSWRNPEPHSTWQQIDLEQLKFPSNFNWGSATAAHQIEGNNTNNWSSFEERTGIEKSAKACEHWQRWREDFNLLSELGVDSYRFSIEWSRIEPEQGEWNEEVVSTYSEMVDDLLQRGIKPMVTLHHFTHPIWFEELGGFSKKENLEHWVNYCERIFDVLSDRVTEWCTINEPEVFSIMGYFMGLFPPGRKSIRKTLKVMRNMMSAHALAYRSLKSRRPDTRIGLAKNVTLFDPLRRWNLIHWITAKVLNHLWNGIWISSIKRGRMLGRRVEYAKGSVDFIGLNYYTHVLASPFMPRTIEVDLPKRKHQIMTEFGYPMYAEGLHRAIEMIAVLKVPIEITENGVADGSDSLRPEHLRRHLLVLSQAIEEGYNIRSYHHWSLMDNFEWAEGYKLRFGLFSVDYETQERTMRESGRLFKEIIANN